MRDSDCSEYNNNNNTQRSLQVCHDLEAVSASADIIMERVQVMYCQSLVIISELLIELCQSPLFVKTRVATKTLVFEIIRFVYLFILRGMPQCFSVSRSKFMLLIISFVCSNRMYTHTHTYRERERHGHVYIYTMYILCTLFFSSFSRNAQAYTFFQSLLCFNIFPSLNKFV